MLDKPSPRPLLGKLIKYDITIYTKRYMLIPVVMASIWLTAFVATFIDISFITSFLLVISIFATIGGCAYFAFILVLQLYRQLCGRESYFTYMIPAGTKQLIISKVIAAIIWGAFAGAVLLLYWYAYYHTAATPAYKTFFDDMVAQIGDKITLLLFVLIPQAVMFVFQLMLCISFVNIPSLKNKSLGIAAAFGGWIIIGQAIGGIIVVAWLIYILFNGGSFSNDYLNSPENFHLTESLLKYITPPIMIVFSVVFFFISTHILEKHRSI